MQRSLTNCCLVLLTFTTASLICTPAAADWSPDNPDDVALSKWRQLPDLSPNGMDVLATIQPNQPTSGLWKILADDFRCTQSGPITDIHIWGSWLNNVLPSREVAPGEFVLDPGAVTFKLSIHSDVPDPNPTDPADYSHPGEQLWSAFFLPGTYQVNPNYSPTSVQESFYDPNLGQIIGIDNQVFQYNFDPIPEPFIQEQGKIYWLDVQALVHNADGTPEATFGWKTRDPNPEHFGGGHFNDDAVFADTDSFGDPVPPEDWRELRYPEGHELAGLSIDLSFVLTVPEPSSVAMAGLGLIALAGMIYRRRRAS
jgi:hypothetical protein